MGFRELLLLLCSYRLLAQRAYLCDRVHAITNGSISVDRGLQGIHLHIGSGIYDTRFLRINDLNQYEGLEIDLLDELARHAGFTYSIVIHDWTNLNISYRQALRQRKEMQDMITFAYWFITPSRMAMGAYSPYGFLDSMLFATVIPPEKAKFSFDEIFSFLTPFSPMVWISFIGSMVGTGLMYRCLEGAANDEDYPDGPKGALNCRYLMDSIFKSFGHITGASGFSPKTWPGKILLISWTWCVVLILSAYTANLASFLVVKAENSVGFTNLKTAVTQGKTVSVQQGTPLESWFIGYIEKNRPDYKHMQSVPLLPEDRAMMLLREQSDAAIFPQFEVDILKQLPSVNPRCEMKTIGDPLLNIQAGWMVTNDAKEYCTNLVRDALAVWFLRMDLNGTLQSLVSKHLTPVVTCPESVDQAASDATRLEIENMLGILSMHGVVAVVALILFCAEHCRNPVKTVKSFSNFGLSEEPRSEAEAKTEAGGTVEVAIEEPVFVKEPAVEEIPREPTALSAVRAL